MRDFCNYNFDYVYQVRDYNSRGEAVEQVMSGKNTAIPGYLMVIKESYDSLWNFNRQAKMRKITGVQGR